LVAETYGGSKQKLRSSIANSILTIFFEKTGVGLELLQKKKIKFGGNKRGGKRFSTQRRKERKGRKS